MVFPVHAKFRLHDLQGVLLDQFGVMHDGKTPYDGAVEAVQALADTGLRIVLVSNSSRRRILLHSHPSFQDTVSSLESRDLAGAAAPGKSARHASVVILVPVGSSGAIAKLQGMGFNAACFHGAITSGEITHGNLLHRPGEFWQTLGRRCLHFTWGSRGAISLEGLDLEVQTVGAESEHCHAFRFISSENRPELHKGHPSA
jgi:Haloacid dehalogenase-like hydrolase